MEDTIRNYTYPIKLKKEYVEKLVVLNKIASKFEEYKDVECKKYLDNPLNLFRHMGYFWNLKDGIKKSSDILQNCIKWRKRYEPQNVYKKKSFLDYVKKNKLGGLDVAFFHGVDKKGHIICYIFLDKEKEILPRDEKRMDFFFDLVCFMMEDVTLRIMKKNDYQVTSIVDANNIGLSHGRLVHPFIKKFVDTSDYYYERLYVARVVNTGLLIRGMWNIATPFLYKSTVKKYQFCKNTEILKKIVNEDQIPARLGGKVKVKYSLAEHIELHTKFREKEEEIEGENN